MNRRDKAWAISENTRLVAKFPDMGDGSSFGINSGGTGSASHRSGREYNERLGRGRSLPPQRSTKPREQTLAGRKPEMTGNEI